MVLDALVASSFHDTCHAEGVAEAMKSILVIDDETMILEAIKIIFEDMGYSVKIFADSQTGVEEAVRNDYDLILVDLRMPGVNGAEATEAIRKAKGSAKILIITAYPNDPLAARALEAGAVGLLTKPFEIARVLDFLNQEHHIAGRDRTKLIGGDEAARRRPGESQGHDRGADRIDKAAGDSRQMAGKGASERE
jgi:CheY-like chemotaxis protein